MATVATATKPQGASPVTVGSVLKQARETAGLTRAQLGQNTGISPRTIEKFEYDTADPSIGSLKKLCDALDLDYGDVMAEVGMPSGDAPPIGKTAPIPPSRPATITRPTPVSQSAPQARSAASPGAQALAKVAQLMAAGKFNTIALASAADDAQSQLSKLSYPDLFKVAAEVQFEAADVLSPSKVVALSDDDDQEDAKQGLACRLVVAAIAPDFEKLSATGLQNLADDIGAKLSWWDDTIKKFDGISPTSQALAPEYLALVESRQAIDLSNVKRYPRQSGSVSSSSKSGGASVV